MHAFSKCLLLLAGLALLSPCSASSQSTLEKVRALNLKSLDGPIKTCYPQGYRHRAEANAKLLGQSTGFFEEQFGVSQPFSIALIDSARWVTLTPIPYGLPFVSGPPYVVCLPADSKNILSNTLAEAIEGYDLDQQFAMSNEELVNLYVSLIGFHELGHIYASAYGMSFPNRWTYEFAATYFAYCYLDRHHPKERDMWVETSRTLAKELDARHTSLEDFERLYVKVGVENYAWYQVAFLLQVDQVHQERGVTFLNELKNHPWHSSSASHYLSDMEQMGPGFTDWAQQYRLQE